MFDLKGQTSEKQGDMRGNEGVTYDNDRVIRIKTSLNDYDTDVNKGDTDKKKEV